MAAMAWTDDLVPQQVAVVEITGPIGARVNPRDTTRLINSLRRNKRYPAVVLDIDSPGGSAAASETIYNAVRKLARRKPVAAVIRGVGASGGYMIACGANPIYALPTSIVGSIGVIWMMPLLSEALDRLGIRMRTETAGEYKDMGSVFRESTPEEEERLRELLESVYQRFIDIVEEGRPDFDRTKVEGLATGEIHTGMRAKDLGLVDELGDLDDAVERAAEMAGIAPRSVLMRPKPKLMQMLMQRGANALVDTAIERVSVALEERAAASRVPRPR